ncbi:MAG: hypothetical protein DCC75_06820 [Proteobacteria bacterium]|nr:MAG: hypothetical protein DCC75_06820 [Pseudomonadota bacterium]
MAALRIFLLSRLGYLILRFLSWSWSWSCREFVGLADFLKLEYPKLIIFWHNRQMMLPEWFKHVGGRPDKVCALSSRHPDGRIMAKIIALFGYRNVEGSSTRGGFGAILKLGREIEQGYSLALTPDGPKGPIYKFKSGVPHLAAHYGVPVYLVACTPSRFWSLKNWDRFVIPKPFARITYKVLGPFTSPGTSKDVVESFRVLLEAELAKLTEEVDGELAA